MVDSEDITLEKTKTQELSLEINTLSNTFHQSTTIQDPPSESPQVQVMDPNNKSKSQFKEYCSFCHKNNHSVSTCFRRLNMLKDHNLDLHNLDQNHNLDLRLLPFINILKALPINLIIPATVVEVIVTLPANLATLDINLVLIHVHIHVLDLILKLPHGHIRLTTIVIDLDIINILIRIPSNHTLLHVHIITLIPLRVHLNFTLVLVNVPQSFLLLIDTILLIVLLLNHAMIVFVVDLIQIQTIILNPNTNHP